MSTRSRCALVKVRQLRLFWVYREIRRVVGWATALMSIADLYDKAKT